MPTELQPPGPNASPEERLRYVAEWSADHAQRHPEPRWLVTVSGRNATGMTLTTSVSEDGCTQAEAVQRTRAAYEGMILHGLPLVVTHCQAIDAKQVSG